MTGAPDPKALRIATEAEGYYELELYEEALERAETLLSMGALEIAGLAMKAECLRSLERYEEGAAVFERILARDDANVAAYVGLGWCRKRSGRLDLAIESMERLLAGKPDEPIGLYNLACYLSLRGDREPALELLGRAVALEEEFRKLATEEEDFAPLRRDRAFLRLTEG